MLIQRKENGNSHLLFINISHMKCNVHLFVYMQKLRVRNFLFKYRDDIHFIRSKKAGMIQV